MKKVKELIKAIFEENKSRYGYRRVTLELKNRGHIVNHKRVKKLMKLLNLFNQKQNTNHIKVKSVKLVRIFF